MAPTVAKLMAEELNKNNNWYWFFKDDSKIGFFANLFHVRKRYLTGEQRCWLHYQGANNGNEGDMIKLVILRSDIGYDSEICEIDYFVNVDREQN